MSACRKCGREGKRGFSADLDGLYCTNFGACRKRRERNAARATRLMGTALRQALDAREASRDQETQ